MIPLMIIFSVLMSVISAFGQNSLGDCKALEWDYESDPELGYFRIYVSRESGVYAIDPVDPKKSRPSLIVPAIPEMVTVLVCQRLQAVVRTPGTYYAVVTAVTRDFSFESEASNEITFLYENQTVAVHPPLTTALT